MDGVFRRTRKVMVFHSINNAGLVHPSGFRVMRFEKLPVVSNSMDRYVNVNSNF